MNYASASNDVWSLGVILVNLTCGRNPWKRASHSDSTFRAYLKNPRFLRTILPLSAELDDILRSIFEIDPVKRITIRELRTRIQHCQRFTTGPGPAMCTTPPPSDVSSDRSGISTTSDTYDIPNQQCYPHFKAPNGTITPPSPSTPAPFSQQDMFLFPRGKLPATPPLSPPQSPVEAQKPTQFAPPPPQPSPVSSSSPQVVVSHPQLNTSWQVATPILDQMDKLRSPYFSTNNHLVPGPQGVPCYWKNKHQLVEVLSNTDTPSLYPWRLYDIFFFSSFSKLLFGIHFWFFIGISFFLFFYLGFLGSGGCCYIMLVRSAVKLFFVFQCS